MVNPYLIRQQSKPQIQLGQSQALKKFEKFNAKYNSSSKNGPNERKQIKSDDDDSLILNIKASSKKFIKKKQEENDSNSSSDQSLTESKHSEISIDFDRSSTPVPAKRQSLTKPQHITQIPVSHRSSSRIRSAASSVSSIRSLNKRSVKFLKTDSNENSSDDDDASTEIEDMLSKNLILNIDELATPSYASKKSYRKYSDHKMSKSPLGIAASRRSESVTSIREDDELFENNKSSDSEKSISKANNLILDINDLEKSLSTIRTKPKNIKKEKTSKKKANKKADESTSTIKTESITDNDIEEMQDQLKSYSSEKISIKKKKSKKKPLASYISDFEDVTTATYKNKQTTQMKNAESQVDPTELFKNGHIVNSIDCFNPSSMLLATTSYLSNETTLKDLNQITGYTMITQAFNDLIKMNVTFMNNFLISQRNIYQQQIRSIQPKE